MGLSINHVTQVIEGDFLKITIIAVTRLAGRGKNYQNKIHNIWTSKKRQSRTS